MAEKARTEGQKEPPPELSWQELSAIATILGAYAYIAGSAALLVPIARTYMSFDLATAWYAVSLVPRNIVIGHAVRLAASRMGPLILLAICFLLVYFVAQHFADTVDEQEENQSDSNRMNRITRVLRSFHGYFWRHFFLVVPLMVGLVSILVFMLLVIWSVVARGDRFTEHGWVFVINFLLICGALVLWGYLTHDALCHDHKVGQRRVLIPRVRSWRRLVEATAAYLFVAYSGILITAVLAAPPLPQVEIYGRPGGEDVSGSLIAKGTLLTHTDGFWYIFVQQANSPSLKQEITLRAISDDTVAQVNVSSRP